MVNTQKVVFTGAPSSGKTTLLNSVKHPNIHTYNEVSRAVINQAQKMGIHRPFLENPLAFSEVLFEKRLLDFFAKSSKQVQLYDRGLHDVIAFLKEKGQEVPCGMHEVCTQFSYNKVFIFPPWKEIYTQDAERNEDFLEALKLHDALVETYTFYGMKCKEVPRDSVNNRLDFILDNLWK